MRLALLVPLMLPGCDSDSLYSTATLERLYGISPIPVEPYLEIRWIKTNLGLGLNCIYPLENYDSDPTDGTVVMPLPEVDEPPFWNETEHYSWAAGLAVLINKQMYNPFNYIEEEEEEEGESAPLGDEFGVWGGVEDHVLFFGRGELLQLADEVVLSDEVDDFYKTLESGGVWMGVVPELVSQTGGIEGTIFPLSEADSVNEGIELIFHDWLSDMGRNMLSGASLESIYVECD